MLEKVRDKLLRRRPKALTLEGYTMKLKQKGLKLDGSQDVSSVPMAPPVGYKKQPSMVEIVRDMVRSENLRREAEAAGRETFEESEDFDVGDEPELLRSEYENDFDPSIAEVRRAGEEVMASRARQIEDATGIKPRNLSEEPSRSSRKAVEPPPDGQDDPPRSP